MTTTDVIWIFNTFKTKSYFTAQSTFDRLTRIKPKSNMKKSLILLTLLFPILTEAQKSQGGIKAGWNTSQIVGTPKTWDDVSFDHASSWHLGVFGNIGLTDALGVRGELLFSRKGSLISIQDSSTNVESKLELDYITIPIMLQYKMGFLSVHAGPEIGLKVRGESSNEDYFITDAEFWDQPIDLSLVGGATVHLGNIEITGRYGHSLFGLAEIETTDPDGRISGKGTHGHLSFWQVSVGFNLF